VFRSSTQQGAPRQANLSQGLSATANLCSPFLHKTNSPFSAALSNSTAFTLLGSIEGIPIPEELTGAQKKKICSLLKYYSPELLKSALVDVHGEKIELDIHYDSAILRTLRKESAQPLNEDQREFISTIFNDYSSHLTWQRDNIEVRKVKKREVSRCDECLIGQQGVFLKKYLPKDVFVLAFDGMLITDLKHINADMKLRKLANVDNYHSTASRDKGFVLEGMGASMKLNTAKYNSGDFSFDTESNNLDGVIIDAVDKKTSEVLKLILFKTNRDVQKDEQLCFPYSVTPTR
jgi:hypothetical protein